MSGKLPYFGRNFNASTIHAVWAVLNRLQLASEGPSQLEHRSFFQKDLSQAAVAL